MEEVVLELAAEVGSVVVLGVVGSVLGLGGFLMEEIGLASLSTGEVALGLWYLYMGTLALYVAVYLIGVRELPTRVAAIRAALSS